jgi:hypothetical protein
VLKAVKALITEIERHQEIIKRIQSLIKTLTPAGRKRRRGRGGRRTKQAKGRKKELEKAA